MAVSYIINVSISAEKLTLVRLFPFQYFSRWLNNGGLKWFKIAIFQWFLGLIRVHAPIEDEGKTSSANCDLNPKSVTF